MHAPEDLRIVGECKKLGMTVSATSVRNLLRRHRLRPAPRTSGPSWSQFIRAQAAGTLACDFFHVDTVVLRRVYVLFFIDLERRVVFLAGVTAHPAGPWVTQRARNLVATMEDKGRALRFLVRDRDAKFVGPFDEVMRSIGARVVRTPVRAPRANAFAEHFVRTTRAECLDWVLVRNERHLDRVLREFVRHYNHEHPHRGIDLEVPVPYLTGQQFDGLNGVERTDRLGVLLHEYRIGASSCAQPGRRRLAPCALATSSSDLTRQFPSRSSALPALRTPFHLDQLPNRVLAPHRIVCRHR